MAFAFWFQYLCSDALMAIALGAYSVLEETMCSLFPVHEPATLTDRSCEFHPTQNLDPYNAS